MQKIIGKHYTHKVLLRQYKLVKVAKGVCHLTNIKHGGLEIAENEFFNKFYNA